MNLNKSIAKTLMSRELIAVIGRKSFQIRKLEDALWQIVLHIVKKR